MRKVVNLNGKPTAGKILVQLFISSAIVLGSYLFIIFLSLILAAGIFNISLFSLKNVNWSAAPDNLVNAFKFIQVVSTIGLFILPALLLPYLLFHTNTLRFNGLKKQSGFLLYLLAILALYLYTPTIDLSTQFNASLHLPVMHFFGYEFNPRALEDMNDVVMKRLLIMPDFQTFLINAFVIALLPAIAEELFFRGFVQGTLYTWFGRKHLAVIVTAAFFSFFHMQFYGFIPRMLLGMLLGYLYIWSGNIKVNMLVHFLNNFTVVLMAYIYQQQGKPFDLNSSTHLPAAIYLLSFIAGSFVLYIYYLNTRKRRQKEENSERNDVLPQNVKWKKIFSTPDPYQAEIIAGNLRSEGIEAVVLNKRDSMYTIFGQAEVYVPENNVETAQKFLPE